MAGLIGALVVLPQGVAYATLAGMPPQYGLYCAMLPAIVAALWGSSWHQVSGPTNAISLVVFATMAPLAVPGTDAYIELVLTLALLVGLLQFGMGVARLGALVNFISHTVVIGFTAGAGLLIIAAQFAISSACRSRRERDSSRRSRVRRGTSRTSIHGSPRRGWRRSSSRIAAKRWMPRIAVHDRRDDRGQPVRLCARRPPAWPRCRWSARCRRAFPSLSLPSFDPETWRTLFPAALALTVLGLDGGGIDRPRRRAQVRAAHRRQPGVHRPGTVEHRRRVQLGVPVVGLVQPQRRQLRSRRAARRSRRCSRRLLLVVVLLGVAPLAAYLPLAVMAGTAVRRRLGADRRRRDARASCAPAAARRWSWP